MTEDELTIPEGIGLSAIEKLIEECAAASGLTTRLKTSLASYSGSIHWHFRRSGELGTLEVTFWPERRRCWLSVHTGRNAGWVCDGRAALALAIHAGFGSLAT